MHALARPFLLVPFLAPFFAASCVAVPEDGEAPALTTEVDDWRDEVIYQVLTDRFANGDPNNDFAVRPGQLARFQGGDYQGMREHLGYLQELGVTTLWISPIVKNVETDANVDSYHGYWAQDLTELNPHFGDIVALRQLTAAAHARKMKVVLDIVTNHMGQVFFYDMNLNGTADENVGGTGKSSPVERTSEFDPDFDPRGIQAVTSLGEAGRAPLIFFQLPEIHRLPPKPGILGTAAAYHGMGRTLNYDDEKQRLMGDFPGGLKDVATELPEVRATMIDAYTHWAEAANLDGFRIDTVKHVEDDFWNEFAGGVRTRLAKQGKKKFLMFGEAFDGNDQLLGKYTQPGRLDSVFYFSQHYQVFRNVFKAAKHDPENQSGTDQIKALWDARLVNWGGEAQPEGVGVAPAHLPVSFIDNHDVSRFLFDTITADDPGGDKDALRNALTFLITEEGIPCVYYGTELDFAGGNDPSNREVLWNTGFPTDGTTFRHLKKLLQVRKDHAALRRGATLVRWSSPHTREEDDAGIFAFERSGDGAKGDFALVVLNTNARKASATVDGERVMTVDLDEGTTLVDALEEKDAFKVGAGKTLRVDVPAQRARILVKK